MTDEFIGGLDAATTDGYAFCFAGRVVQPVFLIAQIGNQFVDFLLCLSGSLAMIALWGFLPNTASPP
jgi:hypothetical protein